MSGPELELALPFTGRWRTHNSPARRVPSLRFREEPCGAPPVVRERGVPAERSVVAPLATSTAAS